MGQVKDILVEWYSTDPQKEELYFRMPELPLRWVNEGQLRYADKSELLRGSWSATVTSGTASLPSDFLREIPDRVKWDTTTHLYKIDYPTANLVESWSDTSYYSIWGNTFYVWAAASGTPTVPYIKKPSVIAIANISTADFDSLFPTEFHHAVGMYLDSMWLKKLGEYQGSRAMLADFDMIAVQDGQTYRNRRDPVPIMRSSRF